MEVLIGEISLWGALEGGREEALIFTAQVLCV